MTWAGPSSSGERACAFRKLGTIKINLNIFLKNLKINKNK
jgi:hypothetical protein